MAKMKYPEQIVANIPFCPGCGHGIIVRLMVECVEELGYAERVVLHEAVGCCSLVGIGLDWDMLVGAHGGGGANATGLKRMLKDQALVIAYQGDGDAYNIGLSETLNAAYRNENITVIAVNNTNFGMTGGQMSWTTLPGQRTTTSVDGRDSKTSGTPIKIPELIAGSFDTAYVARGTVTSPAEIRKTKGYIKKGLQKQINGEGHSLIEILSPCPTNWHSNPITDALDRIDKELIPYYYPIGELRERGE
jgi:2-oxoglutarate ferredoxin oxidoreductase subunit beta